MCLGGSSGFSELGAAAQLMWTGHGKPGGGSEAASRFNVVWQGKRSKELVTVALKAAKPFAINIQQAYGEKRIVCGV